MMGNAGCAPAAGTDGLRLRRYQPADCAALAALFYDTVHTVNARDYTPAQLDAWADGQVDLAAWDRSLSAHFSLVALLGETIVGFGDLDPAAGYLDRLYVHRDFQRQGIARALCDALEGAAEGPVETHASITARGFFARRGYRVLQRQEVERQGVILVNFKMEKSLR